MNTLKVTFLLTLLTLLFVYIGGMFGGQQGMFLAFALALVMNGITYWFSDKIVLKMYRAREVTEQSNGELLRMVRTVAQRAGLPMPRVYVIPTRAPNAFATGRNPKHAAVAVTEGIQQLLSREELEGVIGHEMAHVKNRDILIGSIVATFAGAIGIIASLARWSALFGGFGGGRGDARGGNPIALLAIAIVAPLAAMLIQTAISRTREYKADATGARITHKPLALAGALQKLHRAPVQLNLDERPATAHMFIAKPLSGRGLTNLFSTHPPMEERIKRLQQMARSGVPVS